MACLAARSWHDPTATRLILLASLLALAACRAAATVAPLPTEPAQPPGTVRVRLAFGEEADLDLYVTDPFQETVYFANPISAASGGALEADLRCDAPIPRVEAVRFAAAPPGRYRVGVDHPARCGSRLGRVPFVVVAEFGAERLERRGEIALGQFLPIVLEFDVPD